MLWERTFFNGCTDWQIFTMQIRMLKWEVLILVLLKSAIGNNVFLIMINARTHRALLITYCLGVNISERSTTWNGRYILWIEHL